MATKDREKFVIQVNPTILSRMRAIARSEGRELQALIDEALVDLIAKRTRTRPRAHVMTAYQASHQKLGSVYKKLAE